LKGPLVPWIVRPISKAIASQVEATFLTPNLSTHYKFLESQMATSPENGQFICGPKLTGADIMLVFPLESARSSAGMTPAMYPKLDAYVTRLQERDAYRRAIAKAEEATGEKFNNLF
jgi:glutathione S-transferase